MPQNNLCRLCFGLSTDLRPIFSEHGYEKKISLYLYLRIGPDDELSQNICWSCANYLDNFHNFSEKITETQKLQLGEKYKYYELQPIYTINVTDEIALEPTELQQYVEAESEAITKEDEIPVVPTETHDPSDVEDEIPLSVRVRRKKEQKLSPPTTTTDDWDLPLIEGFPKVLIKDGQFVVRGKELSYFVGKFYRLECHLCADTPTFTEFKKLVKHFSEYDHPGHPIINCCGLNIHKYRRAVFHMARHMQPDAFRCVECGYAVTRPEFLENHMKTHLAPEDKPLACPHCPKRFVWKYAFEIHVATHKPIEERKFYACVLCEKRYDTPGGLSTHKKMVHSSGEKVKHVCHICAKPFAQKTGLNEHMNTIHQQERERTQLQCNECGAWLMNKRCLKTHMLLHNGVDHKCDLCTYSTKKRTLLNRHKITHHSTGPPAFECDQCPKKFKLRRALTVHMQSSHVGDVKTYECNFCNRTFASPSNFYSHRKNMHPEELARLREKEAEAKRLKRIEVGLEHFESAEEIEPTITIINADDLNLSDGKTQTFLIQVE